MSAHVSVIVRGEQQVRELDDATTWADVLGAVVPGLRGVAVARVDGELVDLDQPVRAGATVEPVMISDPDGLRVLRHSTAHVLAQAVQDLFPTAKLGIGPPIENGFYYDFDMPEPFTPEDLAPRREADGRDRQGWRPAVRPPGRVRGRGRGSSWPTSRTSCELIGKARAEVER